MYPTEVIQLVANVLPVLAMFGIFDSVVAIANGTLCAQGKQGTGAMLNLRSIPVSSCVFSSH